MPARPVNVWIVNPYGTLPGEGWREYRSAMLARALAERDHRVGWWISDIEHRSRRRRPHDIIDPLLPPAVTVHVVPARTYRRNISVGRILYERSFAAGFAANAGSLPRPDAIVLADPSLFFAGLVTAYARRHGVPVIVDVLDLWPELFEMLLPRRVRAIAGLLLAPLYARRDRLVEHAAAVVAVTGDYLAQVRHRVSPKVAEVIYLGVDAASFLPPAPAPGAGGPLELIYAGTLGDAYDMPALIEAIGRLARDACPIHLTIAGDGPRRADIIALATRFPACVTFMGKVEADALPTLYARAHVGLATYSAGSTVSMPVKLFDYMAAGLATIGSMQGEAGALLHQGIGRSYQAGSADALVDAIEGYVADPAGLDEARRMALSEAARFNQAAQHRRFAILIEDIVAVSGA